MSKENQVLKLIKGYADGLITDQECMEMCDLVLNEITIINKQVMKIDKDMIEALGGGAAMLVLCYLCYFILYVFG